MLPKRSNSMRERREQKNKLRREAGRDEGNIDKMKHIQTNRDNNINEVEPINMLFTTHIDSQPSYREPSIYAAHSPTANKEFNQNTIKSNSDKNNEESVEQQQGFLEKCVTVFLDGKQSRNHVNSTMETNPRPINKTFAQEIEDKYFQIPSSSNIPETKPSRRGSLRAFQNVANSILERRGSNGGVISSSAPSKYLTKHPSPIRSNHRNDVSSCNKITKSAADINSSSITIPSNLKLAQPISPVSSSRDFNENVSPYCTPPQSPPPQPLPRTRNPSLNLKKAKNIGAGSPHLQHRPPSTPPPSPAVPSRRSHTPIRLNGGSATRRSSTPCSIKPPLTPSLVRSTSGEYKPKIDGHANTITPASVVREHLAPLLSPAFSFITSSNLTTTLPPTSNSNIPLSNDGHDECLKAINGHGLSPVIRSRRRKSYNKKSPTIEPSTKELEDTHIQLLAPDAKMLEQIDNNVPNEAKAVSAPNTPKELLDTSIGDHFFNINEDVDDKNKNIMGIHSNDPNEEKVRHGGTDDCSSNVPPQLPQMTQSEFEDEYDVVKKIGEGWFSKVYLTEHRKTRQEVALKAVAINQKKCNDFGTEGDDESYDEGYLEVNSHANVEFLREYRNACSLSSHANILTAYDIIFQLTTTATAPQATKADTTGSCRHGYHPRTYCMFAMEYAPFGDLTSMVGEPASGIGEACAKRVARQIGSALDWIHGKNMCHLDVRLNNILVFKSDFSIVKLCDFGSVRTQGDIVIKKNELLPYCPAELVAKHANEYYQVDRCQDVFQFGIVIFFCLFGRLPWQRADIAADPHFAEFCNWLNHHKWRRTTVSGAMAGMAAGAGMGGAKVPKNFKLMTTKAQKLFRKLLDADPTKRMSLGELPKYTEDKWLRSRSNRGSFGMIAAAVAQVVVGSNNLQGENIGLPIQINNQPIINNLITNHQNERRGSGTEFNNGVCDDNSNNLMSDLETNGQGHVTNFGSRSGSTYHLNHSNVGHQDKNGYPGHIAASRFLSDGISQLTMGSFQSVHSNAIEKNRILYTLLQHGVETTVDRSQKNSRIINWIKHGQPNEASNDEPDFLSTELGHNIKRNKATLEKHVDHSETPVNVRPNYGKIDSIYSLDPRLSVSPRINRSNNPTLQDVNCVYNEQSIVAGNAADEPLCVTSTNGCIIEKSNNVEGFIDTVN